MQELIKLFIGCLILIIGYFVGIILARETKSELTKNQKWFKLIVIIGIIGGFTGLIIENDVVLFTGFFIAILTSGSLKK